MKQVIILSLLTLTGCATAPIGKNLSQDREQFKQRVEAFLEKNKEKHLKEIKMFADYKQGDFVYAGRLLKTFSIGEKIKIEEFRTLSDEAMSEELNNLFRDQCFRTGRYKNQVEVGTLVLTNGTKKAEVVITTDMGMSCVALEYQNSSIATSIESTLYVREAQYRVVDGKLTFDKEDVLPKQNPLPKHLRGNKRLIASINKGEIYMGMPEIGVILSWGKPHRVNSTTIRGGYTRKQYVYGSQYVYIENGVVDSWQSSY